MSDFLIRIKFNNFFVFRFLLILLISPLIINLISAKIIFNKGHDCIAQYLLEKNLLNNELKDFSLSNDSDCENYMEEVKLHLQEEINETFEELSEKFETSRGYNKFRLPKGVSNETIRSLIDEPSFMDMMMKLELIRGIRGDEFDEIYDAVQKEFYEYLFIPLLNFTSKEDFGVIFDLIILNDDSSTQLERNLRNYCFRKYLNTRKSVNIEETPYNLTIPSNENCTELIEMSLKTMSNDLVKMFTRFVSTEKQSKRIQSCILKSLNDIEAPTFIINLIFSQSFLNQEPLEGERAKFLEIMDFVKNGTLNCIKKISE